MEFTVIVVDKYGNQLSDEELKNKVIDSQLYYDIVLPIRKRINDEIFRQNKIIDKNSWKNLRNML